MAGEVSTCPPPAPSHLSTEEVQSRTLHLQRLHDRIIPLCRCRRRREHRHKSEPSRETPPEERWLLLPVLLEALPGLRTRLLLRRLPISSRGGASYWSETKSAD